MKLRSSTLLLILQAGIALFGQSVTRAGQPRRFHVQGTISGPADFIELRVVPGIEVRFQSGQSSKIVEADSRGFYQADLPFGLYTMTAQAPKMGAQGIDYFTKYVRPLFRVTSPTVLILNGTLHMARLTCDIVLASDSPELQREESKNSCGERTLSRFLRKTPYHFSSMYDTRSGSPLSEATFLAATGFRSRMFLFSSRTIFSLYKRTKSYTTRRSGQFRQAATF